MLAFISLYISFIIQRKSKLCATDIFFFQTVVLTFVFRQMGEGRSLLRFNVEIIQIYCIICKYVHSSEIVIFEFLSYKAFLKSMHTYLDVPFLCIGRVYIV